MRIEFESTGGIANLHLQYQTDLDQLSAELADQLRKLVAESESSDQSPNERQEPRRGADAISYKLSVHAEDQTKSFAFTDLTAPEEVQPLLHHLMNLAVKQKMEQK